MTWQGWTITVAVLVAVGTMDLGVIARRRRTVTIRDATRWVCFYIGLAAVFALVLLRVRGHAEAGEFVGGYITEYGLSVDNLFVFLLIMTKLRVPPRAQDKGLYIGIVLSLALRTVFIVTGAVIINRFAWAYYGLAAFLIYSAIRLAFVSDDTPEEFHEYAVVRWVRRVLPMVDAYDGDRVIVRSGRRRLFTPLLIAILAIGIANVVFALDSIPAIFGLTTDPYVIFTANAFALMGLRQLYFLVAGLLSRLRYLDIGLCVILCFIGVKLLFEALHASGVPVPSISIAISLAVIVATLAVTVAVGWIRDRRPSRAETAAEDAAPHDLSQNGQPAARPEGRTQNP